MRSPDHLRLSVEAVHELGEAAQVLAAIWASASAKQGYSTFASYDTLAGVACCSSRNVQRAVADDGPLVRAGYILRVGRQACHPGTRRKRRTITIDLTSKAVEAYKRFYKLPRAPVIQAQQQRRPMGWGERLLLAVLVSHHDRIAHSLRKLVKGTGLSMPAVIEARRRLAGRGLISIKIIRADGACFLPSQITLNDSVGVLKIRPSRCSTSVLVPTKDLSGGGAKDPSVAINKTTLNKTFYPNPGTKGFRVLKSGNPEEFNLDEARQRELAKLVAADRGTA